MNHLKHTLILHAHVYKNDCFYVDEIFTSAVDFTLKMHASMEVVTIML